VVFYVAAPCYTLDGHRRFRRHCWPEELKMGVAPKIPKYNPTQADW